ncbi:MAG: DUF3108 domain-containing protein [Burkholderiales bacterium]|nr:DUF3108 domain-containing protein [Burkholderiales bacterium]
MRIRRPALLAGAAALLVHAALVQGLLAIDAAPRWRDDRPPRLQALYVRTIEPQRQVLAEPPVLPRPAAAPPALRWLDLPTLPEPARREQAPAAPLEGMLARAPDDEPGGAGAAGTERDEEDEEEDKEDKEDEAGQTGREGGQDGDEDIAGDAGDAADTYDPQGNGRGNGSARGPGGAGANPAADRFDWPPSTRLRYALVGHWRGPLEGRAQVEWLRAGDRYQVHLDIVIGAPFAPLITRQMSSDGRLAADGLRPERYDERTRVLWRAPVLQTVRIDGDRVRLADGRVVARPPGLQDAVSQFVQLAWRFTREPWRLVPGQLVTLPLALPRRVGLWHYDVRDVETIDTPAGPVQALRLEPRVRARGGADLIPEVWYAPALQYLPVRILVRHDDESYVDLTIDRLPEQAAPEAGLQPAAAPATPGTQRLAPATPAAAPATPPADEPPGQDVFAPPGLPASPATAPPEADAPRGLG